MCEPSFGKHVTNSGHNSTPFLLVLSRYRNRILMKTTLMTAVAVKTECLVSIFSITALINAIGIKIKMMNSTIVIFMERELCNVIYDINDSNGNSNINNCDFDE